MKNKIISLKKSLLISLVALSFSGCHTYDNFTTFFNTFYNQNRLIKESEDEFAYQDEKKRVTPRVLVPDSKIDVPAVQKAGPPPFMTEFVIEQQKLQPVKVKLDSIIIKGSKILAYHPGSDYIQNTLYLMAKAYFYRNEWLPSQIKCSELIDKFPDGDYSPDAHLLFSENLLIQKRFYAGKIMLSRTVDIAWQKKRYDILSVAFRLEADLALFENDPPAALKPYRQAIAKSEDDEMRAKWQVDLASILYRLGKYSDAEKAFHKVMTFSPDYQAEFEAKLYRAMCLIRLNKTDEADKILDDLDSDGKFTEWKPFVYAAKMTEVRLYAKKDDEFAKSEKFADSAYVNNTGIQSVYYEKGMDAFAKKDYPNARKYFARTRGQRTPFYATSERLFFLLNTWEQKHTFEAQTLKKFKSGDTPNDTIKAALAMNRFELGRVHEELGNKDSAIKYYKYAAESSPQNDKQTARFVYAYSRMIRNQDPIAADSLLDIIAEKYPLTEFGKEAIQKQGYTENFVIDTVAELYTSGTKLRMARDYPFAVSQLSKIYSQFPNSPFAPRSLYALGWIYEKNIANIDSALFYYKTLVDKYPNSEYANDVKLSVTYLSLVRSGKPIPDSIMKREKIKKAAPFPAADATKVANQPTVNDTKKPQRDDGKTGVSPLDMLKNPTDFFNKTKDQMLNPDNFMPNLNLPKNPLKDMQKKDSTKTAEPPPPPNKK